MEIRKLVAYSDVAQTRTFKVLETCPQVFHTEFETLAKFNSIAKLMAHIIGTEQRWVTTCFLGEPRPSRYELTAPDSLEQMKKDYSDIRARLYEGLNQDLSETVKDILGDGTHITISKKDVVFHIINHQTYHRGQISMALQRFGIDPPNFDYPHLLADMATLS